MDRLLMIHGYNHDPNVEKHSPFRKGGNFDLWPRIFIDHDCEPLAWYSAIQGRDAFRAWRNGCRTTYGYAYKVLAPAAAKRAIDEADWASGQVDIVAHSLGTRVALLAIAERPELFRRVLLLNGAETVAQALPVIWQRIEIDFVNIAVHTDDIVKHLGATFEPSLGRQGCIGNGMPPGARRLPNFQEVILDDPVDKKFYQDNWGWSIDGDGEGFGDHSFSFENPDNHELLRAALNGQTF